MDFLQFAINVDYFCGIPMIFINVASSFKKCKTSLFWDTQVKIKNKIKRQKTAAALSDAYFSTSVSWRNASYLQNEYFQHFVNEPEAEKQENINRKC